MYRLLTESRYTEQSNASGKVGRLGKGITNFKVFANSYIAIEDILCARTADFVKLAYFCEACFIEMTKNVL
jgi:hypothetical protein